MVNKAKYAKIYINNPKYWEIYINKSKYGYKLHIVGHIRAVKPKLGSNNDYLI